MEKLVEKYKQLQIVTSEEKELNKRNYMIVPTKCAEEARKLAIEFAKSLNGMCIGSWNLEHTYNELFDKFIDEYYE